MAKVVCTTCGHELTAHCAHCGWLCCVNARCTVRFYDIARRVRSLRDGTIEPMATG